MRDRMSTAAIRARQPDLHFAVALIIVAAQVCDQGPIRRPPRCEHRRKAIHDLLCVSGNFVGDERPAPIDDPQARRQTIGLSALGPAWQSKRQDDQRAAEAIVLRVGATDDESSFLAIRRNRKWRRHVRYRTVAGAEIPQAEEIVGRDGAETSSTPPPK